jgi:hypothetical protein
VKFASPVGSMHLQVMALTGAFSCRSHAAYIFAQVCGFFVFDDFDLPEIISFINTPTFIHSNMEIKVHFHLEAEMEMIRVARHSFSRIESRQLHILVENQVWCSSSVLQSDSNENRTVSLQEQ